MNKETLKRVPLSSVYRNSAAVLPWMLCAATLMASGPAQAGGALPTNGQYVAGQGSITSAGSNVTVNQTSSHGIINWQNFSVGQGNSVLFTQRRATSRRAPWRPSLWAVLAALAALRD